MAESMIFLKVKSIILDHLMTIALTFGVYYGWFINNNQDFKFIFSDLLLIYIIAYTLQKIAT
ncbi:MAG: hypothetical protein ACOC3T_04990, partial [Bacteroidota bacterium]